ncbi:MAG: 27kDa outer membrane protein [Nitrospira sp.]|jgi:protein-disulfide isomerase|nr:MAG: 27kDa outer membrane protein [Nitrospira sp.]
MQRRKSRPALSSVLFLAMILVGNQLDGRAGEANVDPAVKHSWEQVIEEYIRTHPEVIEQSLQALENKRAAEEHQRQQAAIVAHQQDLLHDPTSPVSGNPTGDVTVVEFFDYRCGFCKKAASAVTQLQQDDAGVRIVYKDFPILGEASELAAKAALASVLQGKHRTFHEALLAAKGDLTKEQILHIAQGEGLDITRLERDMANPEWQAVIDRNRLLAKNLGINGTPAFIVGHDLVPGALDINMLQELVARRRMP